jgi:hypothetical protein
MSGGSFNYLYRCTDLEDLCHRDIDLREMVAELVGLDAPDIAAEIEGLRLSFRALDLQIGLIMRRNSAALRAVEWWRSGDCKVDQVREAIAEVRARRNVDPAPT